MPAQRTDHSAVYTASTNLDQFMAKERVRNRMANPQRASQSGSVKRGSTQPSVPTLPDINERGWQISPTTIAGISLVVLTVVATYLVLHVLV